MWNLIPVSHCTHSIKQGQEARQGNVNIKTKMYRCKAINMSQEVCVFVYTYSMYVHAGHEEKIGVIIFISL